MAHLVKVLAIQPDDPRLSPGIYMKKDRGSAADLQFKHSCCGLRGEGEDCPEAHGTPPLKWTASLAETGETLPPGGRVNVSPYMETHIFPHSTLYTQKGNLQNGREYMKIIPLMTY